MEGPCLTIAKCVHAPTGNGVVVLVELIACDEPLVEANKVKFPDVAFTSNLTAANETLFPFT